ncbi:MAG: M28 family peptidase [Proteobacteria bacterium]|nr:M28 family peptidase [Pseudomonadota bacterium]
MKDRILETIRHIEGPRDGCNAYNRLEECGDFIADCFRSSGFVVEYDLLEFSGRQYRNIIATASGLREMEDWVMVCAHYDAVPDSPGADDNASGVAVMLELARQLGPRKGLQLVAFTLEEPQQTGTTFLLGSKHFVKEMKRQGQNYRAVYNLESVGYVNSEPGSQSLPFFVKAPKTGDFIAVVANAKSHSLIEYFERAAADCTPHLEVFPYKVPLNGYILPESRFSDHAPFWDAGYPAVMVTDTAMLRNPNYHTTFDKIETLSPDFMSQVAQAMIRTVSDILKN